LTLDKAEGVDRAHLTIAFCPPDNRRRDLDNMLASFKHGIDAISEAIGIDDYGFGFTIMRGEPVKGGCVRVTIGDAA
jgi:crossover junction endodeoxyribonuclease RusA